MRTRRTLLNLAYALLSSVVVLVLGLVTRKLLVVNQSRRRQYFHTDQWAASYSRATLAA